MQQLQHRVARLRLATALLPRRSRPEARPAKRPAKVRAEHAPPAAPRVKFHQQYTLTWVCSRRYVSNDRPSKAVKPAFKRKAAATISPPGTAQLKGPRQRDMTSASIAAAQPNVASEHAEKTVGAAPGGDAAIEEHVEDLFRVKVVEAAAAPAAGRPLPRRARRALLAIAVIRGALLAVA